jgi:hypothetical protein
VDGKIFFTLDLPLTAVADTIVLPVVVVYVDRNRVARTPFAPIATSGRDDRYSEGGDLGGSMSSSPEKRGRISRWRSRMQWRRLLGRVRSGRIRRRRSRKPRRVTVEDLYPSAANEKKE